MMYQDMRLPAWTPSGINSLRVYFRYTPSSIWIRLRANSTNGPARRWSSKLQPNDSMQKGVMSFITHQLSLLHAPADCPPGPPGRSPNRSAQKPKPPDGQKQENHHRVREGFDAVPIAEVCQPRAGNCQPARTRFAGPTGACKPRSCRTPRRRRWPLRCTVRAPG